jgi:transcription elongation factor Elf1
VEPHEHDRGPRAGTPITKERAERIARGHACEICGEYSYKRLTVTPATQEHQRSLGEVWHVRKVCGICGQDIEMGIDAEGEIVY